jgi:nitrogen fixation-related uncharacterized protein
VFKDGDMSNRLQTVLRTAIIVLSLLILLPLALLGLVIALWVIDIPRRIGQYFDFEGAIRRVLYRVIDPEEMRLFRDDMLHIVESEVEMEDGLDRWGLLREIDKSQEKIELRLKNGEFAFSFVGGVVALLVGNILGIVYGGVVLTLVGLLFSFLVTVRIIITDTLCYKSINHRNEPVRRLALLKGWNTGPIFGTGAVGVAVLSAISSRDGGGYRLGRRILETIAGVMYRDEDKWQVD